MRDDRRARVRRERGGALCGREAPTAWAQKAGCARGLSALLRRRALGAGRPSGEKATRAAGSGPLRERVLGRARGEAGPRGELGRAGLS